MLEYSDFILVYRNTLGPSGLVASDLDHFQFKMPGKCKFLNKWLEQPQYHAWLRNSPDIHKANP
jgi:hypothetical protein